MFLDEVEIRQSITELFSKSLYVDCAVAFVGEKALDFIPDNCKVRMICNLESGATNPYAIKALIDKNIEIKTSERLHAKIYIGDSFTVIGSANLSANGLGLENNEITGWIEAGYKDSTKKGQKNIRKWWLRHWDNAKKITKNDIDKYTEIWSKRRNSRTTTVKKQSLLNVLSSNPDRIKDRRIYFVLYRQNYLSHEASTTLENIQENKSKYGVNVEAYEGWEELPENSYLIDIHVGPRGGITYQGIYKSPERKIIIKFSDSNNKIETLFLCYKLKTISDYSVTSEDIKKLKPALITMLESNDIGFGDDTAKYVEIMEAREVIAKI